jgi:DNA-binding PadR family transcriptional regulator
MTKNPALFQPGPSWRCSSALKQRRKEDSIKLRYIKLRYGSLYTVIDLLLARGLIRAKETSRAGRRPERTVYTLTEPGL